MKRSRVLAVAGVAVVGVVVLRRRLRPRAPISPVIPWLAYVAVNTVPRQDLDLTVGTIFNNIAGFFGSVIMTLIGDIISPIAQAINYAAGVLSNWVVALWSSIQDTIGRVLDVVSFVQAQAQQLFGIAIQTAQNFYDSLIGTVNSVVAHVQDLIDGLASTVWNAVWDVLTSAIAVGGGLYEWVYNTFIAPLYDWISAQFGNLADFVSQIVSDVVNAALEAGGWLYNIVADIARSLIDIALAGIQDIIDVVRGAWDFLVWVAAHPIGWFQSIADQIENLSGESVLGALERGITENETTVNSILDRLFG